MFTIVKAPFTREEKTTIIEVKIELDTVLPADNLDTVLHDIIDNLGKFPSTDIKSTNFQIVLQFPGFRPIANSVQHVNISSKTPSARVTFSMKASEVGHHHPGFSIYEDGIYIDTISKEVEVVPASILEQRKTYEAKIQLSKTPKEEGEMTLDVQYDPQEYLYRYYFSGENFKPHEMLSKRIGRDPKDFIEDFVSQLNEQANREEGDFSTMAAQRWIKGKGKDLWEQFIPEELEKVFWEHQAEIKKLVILSSDDSSTGHILPWEAMYPTDRNGNDKSFLVDQFTVVRQTKGFKFTTNLSFSKILFVSQSEDAPPRAKDEMNNLKKLLRQKEARLDIIDIQTIDPLLLALDDAQFDLLHFACHNTFQPTSPTTSSISLGNDDFMPIHLSALQENHFEKRRPLVFINACRSDGASFNYTQLSGWANSFMKIGAGAFIGTLWEVRDQSSNKFAQHFYQALYKDKDKTLGKALQEARTAIRQDTTDPTWLAYTLYGDPDASIIQRENDVASSAGSNEQEIQQNPSLENTELPASSEQIQET